MDDLPSLHYATHLFNIAKLHIGQTYRFLDEDSFTKQMLEFYNDPTAGKATESGMWYVQYLLVLAFGKAFLSRPHGKEPPGSNFFVRAMSIMPSINRLVGKDSLMVIEALSLAALYLYALDHRENAHLYVSFYNT